MTKKTTLDVSIPACFCLLLVSGCSFGGGDAPTTASTEATEAANTPACTIAVIDLDRVALGIGAVGKMRLALQELEEKTVAELQRLTAPLFGDNAPTGADFVEFDKSAAPLVEGLTADNQKEFAKSIRNAQSQMLVRQNQLRDDFLNEVRPYAFQIARDQGCQLVLTTDQVYVATEQVDITEKVVQRITEINAAAASSQSSAPASPPAKLASGGSFPIH